MTNGPKGFASLLCSSFVLDLGESIFTEQKVAYKGPATEVVLLFCSSFKISLIFAILLSRSLPWCEFQDLNR